MTLAGAEAGVAAKLSVENGTMLWNRSRCFLSGVNLAWIHYGNDFGNNQPHGLYCSLRDALHNTSRAGGHTMRVWLHTEGDHTPQWDANGFVVASDASKTLVSDLQRLLRAAQEFNVLILFVLWNGALLRNATSRTAPHHIKGSDPALARLPSWRFASERPRPWSLYGALMAPTCAGRITRSLSV